IPLVAFSYPVGSHAIQQAFSFLKGKLSRLNPVYPMARFDIFRGGEALNPYGTPVSGSIFKKDRNMILLFLKVFFFPLKVHPFRTALFSFPHLERAKSGRKRCLRNGARSFAQY
ncbi:MAG: hypothetical protein ACLUYS_04065, partial [Allobaculum sp.]|uniref:hypothetical protein n=1 Tax=Allobaculum sp. TaxID=1872463 RepID=UPI00399A1220